MNTEALFLFLILLLGLVLCSFLGGRCNKEGFGSALSSAESSLSNMYNSGANAVESTYDSLSGATHNAYNTIAGSFDNYNHYNGDGSSSQLQNGLVFTDPSGDTVTVITNSNGTLSLQLLQVGQTTPMVLSSSPSATTTTATAPNTFYAPYGNLTATVIRDNNGQIAIQFNVPGQSPIIFTQSGSNANSNSMTSTQYYGSTGYPLQSTANFAYQGAYGGSAGAVTGPYGNTAYYAQGPNGNTVAGTTNQYNPYYNGTSANQYYGPYGGSAGAVTGPYGNTAYYAQGPNGNTYAGVSDNTGYGNQYYSTVPQGVSRSQIPQGQEDLYILKSEVVPPVCPACPAAASCPRQEPCPACPACARCPEPSFECKKVPNYNAIDNEYLPQPVLNDFSQFGM